MRVEMQFAHTDTTQWLCNNDTYWVEVNMDRIDEIVKYVIDEDVKNVDDMLAQLRGGRVLSYGHAPYQKIRAIAETLK